MNTIRLIQGDCITEMQKLINEDVKVDMVLTDVPYGVTKCKWDSIIPFEDMWECLNGITYDDTPILLFGSEPFSSNLRMSNIKEFRYDWIWYKNNGTNFVNAKKMPMKYHEVISVFYRKLPTYNPQFQDYSAKTKKRFKQGEKVNKTKELENPTDRIHGGLAIGHSGFDYNRGKYPESVQFFKVVHNANGTKLHPSQKPIELLEYFIKTYTNPNDTVLDFTMGSGSTGVACQNLNRNFIGIELEEEYFKIANERIRSVQTKLL